MIKIKDSYDVLNSVFEPWQRECLEFSVNQAKTTVEDQFRYYYSTACFDGDKNELAVMMKIKIQDNLHILYQLKDLHTNITKITQIDQYNRVRLKYTDSVGTEANVSASASNSSTTTASTDNFSGSDRSLMFNKTLDEGGASQTNKEHFLQDVLTPLSEKEVPIGTIKEYGDQPSQAPVNAPTYDMSKLAKPIKYQNFTVAQSANENTTTNLNTTSQESASKSQSMSKSESHNTKGTKTDQSEQTVEYTTIDERLKMWNLELPKLRRKFWQSFSNVFVYEYQ